jgi:hypothetical protein
MLHKILNLLMGKARNFPALHALVWQHYIIVPSLFYQPCAIALPRVNKALLWSTKWYFFHQHSINALSRAHSGNALQPPLMEPSALRPSLVRFRSLAWLAHAMCRHERRLHYALCTADCTHLAGWSPLMRYTAVHYALHSSCQYITPFTSCQEM